MVKFPFVTDPLDTWLQTHSISVHNVFHPDEWPAELKTLTECLVDISSPEATHFRGIRDLKDISLVREKLQMAYRTGSSSSKSLEGVLEITMSVVATLQKLRTGSIIPIIPIVTAWLSAIARYAGAGDAVFHDYDYALPRVSYPQQRPLISLEPLHSRGILLLAHHIGDISNGPSVQTFLPPFHSQASLSVDLAEAYKHEFMPASPLRPEYDDFSGMKVQYASRASGSGHSEYSEHSDGNSMSLSSSYGNVPELSNLENKDSGNSDGGGL